MSFELFDRGSTKVVGIVDTATAQVLGQGVLGSVGIREGQTRLTLREPVGAQEGVFWGARIDSGGGSVRLVRVTDSTWDVETLDAGGQVAPGQAVVFVARVTMNPVSLVTAPAAGVLSYVVNADTGSDAGPGTSAQPLASLDEAYARATAGGVVSQLVDILVQPAPINGYTLTAPIPAALLAESIVTRPDESQPGAFTILDTQAAQAGTTAILVVGVGVGAVDGKSIRFTTGAAAGQRRTIREVNGGTDIIPAVEFSPAPAPGDTFEIFEPAITIDVTAFNFDETFTGAPLALCTGPGGFSAQSGPPDPAVVFAGFEFDAVGAGSVTAGSHRLVLYGCETTATVFPSASTQKGALLTGVDCVDLNSAASIPVQLGEAQNAWLGWGLRSVAGISSPADRQGGDLAFIGRALDTITWASGLFHFRGGRCSADFPLVLNGCKAWIGSARFNGIAPRVHKNAGGAGNGALSVGRDCFCEIAIFVGWPAIVDSTGIGIQVTQGGRVHFEGSQLGGAPAVGSDAVRSRNGSQVHIFNAPTYGHAANLDYNVGNGAPVNKGFFAAAGATLAFLAGAGADASIITRDV